MAVDTSTWSWMQPTRTGVDGDAVNSTLAAAGGGSSTLVDASNDNTLLIVYVLLGVGAVAPVILLLAVGVLLRSRRAGRRAARRRVTYNSAPTVDAVIDAWNISAGTGATPNSKPTNTTKNKRPSSSNVSACADARQESAGTLSELAVREFFDVQSDRQQSACSQLYVSVEPPLCNDAQPGTTTYSGGLGSTITPASSTPGSSTDWQSGSDSSMERQARDFTALIGPAASAATTTKNLPQTPLTDNVRTQTTCSDDIVTTQCDPSASLTASAVDQSMPDSSAQNCLWPAGGSTGPTVQTVVVDVEPTPVNGLADEHSSPPPLPCPLSKMRRSEACYDIALLSTSSPIANNVPDDSPSKSSSPVVPTSAAGVSGSRNGAEAEQPAEELVSEEEMALKCLDAIAYDYADNDELHEPTERQRSKL